MLLSLPLRSLRRRSWASRSAGLLMSRARVGVRDMVGVGTAVRSDGDHSEFLLDSYMVLDF